jgi:ceramide glucosyltransferase
MNWLLAAIITLGMVHAIAGMIILARERKLSLRQSTDNGIRPAVTILKPIKGLDGNLIENLKTFFELDYPEYEIVFAIRDHDDPAVQIVRQLQREYIGVRTRLVVNNRDLGHNPKVNNLANAMPYAGHDILVISDSNVRVRADYLDVLVSHLTQPGVELVTSAVRGVGGSGLGSILENVHLNGFVAGSVYTVSRILGIPVTIGKSMCFRRRLLNRLGGWEAMADYLFEDALMGREVIRRGHSISQSFQTVENVNTDWSIFNFVSRHTRWATLRRHLSLRDYIGEIAGNPVVAATVYAALYPGAVALAVWLGVALGKIALDLGAARLIGDRSPWYNYLTVPFKDLVMGLIWLVPFVRHTVYWRGNRFRIGADTKVLPVEKSLPLTQDSRPRSAFVLRTSPREA